tara:strand:- start:12165 stop:13580 length:1416 start_codon:yes stop_codon:yes gene_type:complete
MNEVRKRINKYDQGKKEQLVTLGQDKKKSYKEILAYLGNEIKMSTKMASFHHKILCFKSDGVYQLNKAIESIYGVSAVKSDDRPSGGNSPIDTIDVTLADGTRVKVPYGEISLPDLGDGANINITYSEDNILHVSGQCEFRFSSMIDDIVTETRDLLNTNSIYQDQAVEINSDMVPQIMELNQYKETFMIISDKTAYDLRPLYTRIRKADECRANGIPLKTGVLLEGIYGTGKTLLAFKVAHEAIQNNWSFIYLKDPTLLARVLKLSQTLDNNGNGVIVFVEDVDQVTRGDRNTAMQDILNTLDGGDTKNMNVIALFTTNHIELIEPTFLRGKRIGSIVSMGHLDPKTARQFIDHTFSEYEMVEPEGKITFEKVCENITEAEIVPAFMAEICESVKSNMLFDDSNIVNPHFIQASLESYLRQVKLATKKNMDETKELKVYNALKTLIGDSVEETAVIKDMATDVDNISSNF